MQNLLCPAKGYKHPNLASGGLSLAAVVDVTWKPRQHLTEQHTGTRTGGAGGEGLGGQGSGKAL